MKRPQFDPTIPLLLTLPFISSVYALHHLKRDPVHWVNERDSNIPLTVTNLCGEDIYPAILTQSGTGPASAGFLLTPGDTLAQTVSQDWVGRIWGRTNCTFYQAANQTNPAATQSGQACSTGDCGPNLECQGAGQPPATLAEFTMASNTAQTFYDLSLVDGYNIPMAIQYLGTASNSSTADPDLPPNLTNPICIATASHLSGQGDNSTETFGTNSTYPLPLDQSVTSQFCSGWCPWDCQLSPPQKPGDGVYPYPDDNIQRPLFDPCLSACARWNLPQYCCTGSHSSPGSCSPSYYSTQAKAVCPDAYSYAFDDSTSTFIIPQGGGFEIVMCPSGRSTNILKVFGNQLHALGTSGSVSKQIIQTAQNVTYIKEMNMGAPRRPLGSMILALALGLSLTWSVL